MFIVYCLAVLYYKLHTTKVQTMQSVKVMKSNVAAQRSNICWIAEFTDRGLQTTKYSYNYQRTPAIS